jgi:hypothetical protein
MLQLSGPFAQRLLCLPLYVDFFYLLSLLSLLLSLLLVLLQV